MKLEINDKIKNKNFSITWRLNMLLNEQWVTEDINEEIKKYLEENKNIYTTYQNLWATMKAVLRGKFIVWSSFLKRRNSQQINDFTLHLKVLEKEQTRSKSSRRQEIIKIRDEINEIETKQKQLK
ncbi:hypothetical protein H1C71_014429 [Ictidomys tridecemlineatus]|nr:hypothetical protein H1C71_014429 [Ictidomys tridecemlineatus]